jgi:hypothetical protein
LKLIKVNLINFILQHFLWDFGQNRIEIVVRPAKSVTRDCCARGKNVKENKTT